MSKTMLLAVLVAIMCSSGCVIGLQFSVSHDMYIRNYEPPIHTALTIDIKDIGKE